MKLEVAVLLATHDGARYVEEQLRSLANNSIPFTLHWLDDHSTDDTRKVVMAVAESLKLHVREWTSEERLGVPGAFFYLLEHVQSDVYLFCDQDDIWQPGKIDTTAMTLMAGEKPPAFCFSEPYIFDSDRRERMRRYFAAIGVSAARAQSMSRAFVLSPAVGNTVGISRSLRDLLLTHLEVARSHAIMHDWWLYLLALARGGAQFMESAPTSLYRQHSTNFFGVGRNRRSRSLTDRWSNEQRFRRAISTQARGFLTASVTLDSTENLDVLVSCAQRVQGTDRRLSFLDLIWLARNGMLPLPWKRTLWFSAVSLISDAATQKSAATKSEGLSG